MKHFGTLFTHAGTVTAVMALLLAGTVPTTQVFAADDFDALAKSVEDLDKERVFTDANGQAVTGRLTGVGAQGVVSIERQGGGTIKAKVSDLSLDDRKFVMTWYQEKVLKLGRSLQITAEQRKGKTQETEATVSVSKRSANYEVTIKNMSVLPLEELHVVHRTYKKADNGTERERVYVEGEETIAKIEPGKEFKLETAKQELMGTELDNDFRYTNGARTKTQDRLGGVWLRIYMGDMLIGEFADPKGLTEIETWDAKDKK